MIASAELDVLGTIVTPVSIETSRLEVRAEYFNSPIDLEVLRARFQPYQVLGADPLVLKLTGNAHAVVLRFGAVVFWDCDGVTRAADVDESGRLTARGPVVAAV